LEALHSTVLVRGIRNRAQPTRIFALGACSIIETTMRALLIDPYQKNGRQIEISRPRCQRRSLWKKITELLVAALAETMHKSNGARAPDLIDGVDRPSKQGPGLIKPAP
jgi:hypothetical protein